MARYISLDDGNVTIKLQSYISQINSGLVYIGDYTNGNSGTEIDLDDENRKIILDADSVTVTGTINVAGIKEYVALLTWHASGAPTVDLIKNTLGDTVSWSNVDDLGTNLEASSPSNVFVINKTSNFSTTYNESDANRIIIGKRSNDNVYSLYSWNSAGDAPLQSDNFQFLFSISVYP